MIDYKIPNDINIINTYNKEFGVFAYLFALVVFAPSIVVLLIHDMLCSLRGGLSYDVELIYLGERIEGDRYGARRFSVEHVRMKEKELDELLEVMGRK